MLRPSWYGLAEHIGIRHVLDRWKDIHDAKLEWPNGVDGGSSEFEFVGTSWRATPFQGYYMSIEGAVMCVGDKHPYLVKPVKRSVGLTNSRLRYIMNRVNRTAASVYHEVWGDDIPNFLTRIYSWKHHMNDMVLEYNDMVVDYDGEVYKPSLEVETLFVGDLGSFISVNLSTKEYKYATAMKSGPSKLLWVRHRVGGGDKKYSVDLLRKQTWPGLDFTDA